MKVIVISDLHYDKKVSCDADVSRARELVTEYFDYRKPNLVLSSSDQSRDFEKVNELEM